MRKARRGSATLCGVSIFFIGCSGGTTPSVDPVGPAPGTPEYKQMTKTVEDDPEFKGQRFEDPDLKNKKIK